MTTVKRFDPEAHLHKQGWKGKGTAFKQGHATRPLAVVRKKNLAGIGKDRDEAIPFWDNIFAATAASIMSSTSSSVNGSPSGTPGSNTPALVPTETIRPKDSLSIAARMGREVARRGLYSRFFRGAPVKEEEVEEILEEVSTPAQALDGGARAESSSSASSDEGVSGEKSKSSKSKGKERESAREGETKEEKKARRAARALRKAEKEEKKRVKEEKKAKKTIKIEAEENNTGSGKKRKRKDGDMVVDESPTLASQNEEAAEKRKRKKEGKEKKEKKENKARKEKEKSN